MFAQIPAEIWQFSPGVKGVRANSLRTWAWADIVETILREAVFHECEAEEGDVGKKFEGMWRPTVTIRVAASTVDLFHNGAGGIRAQHYQSVQYGVLATQDICRRLRPKLREFWSSKARNPRLADFDASFKSESCKAWIHQGTWHRQARPVHRTLRVQRWLGALAAGVPEGKSARFKYWPLLMPEDETRIDFKGSWVKDGVVQDDGTVFTRQAFENHEYGYS